MNRYIKYFILIAAMPLACFCAKNDEFTQPSNGGIVKISAGLPESKVSLTPGTDPALALAWEETDEVVVEGTTSSTFTLSEIVDDHKANFEGEAVSGSEFAVYYPSKDILTQSYEGQIQDGNASSAHLVYNAMVEGLSSYESFTFEKVNGAIKLVVKVPSSVTEVAAISITSLTSGGAEQAVFYKTNDAEGEKTATLSLGFTEGTAPDEGVLTAYMMVSWNEVELAEGSRLAIRLTAPGKQCSYQKTIKVSQTTVVAGGETFIIDLSDAKALKHVIAGSGTQADPYLLYDAEDMQEISGLLVAGQVTYFKMMADIDMKDVDYTPGNQADPYNQHIDFNGNNKTIRNFSCIDKAGVYPGLVGVLSGRVANVTLEDPVVSSSKNAGIICGYAGTFGTKPAIIENVNIINGEITQKGGSNTGLIFGHSNVAGCEFTNITVSGTINQNGVGDSGFIGGAQNKGATFTNCHASGTLTIKSSLSATSTATNICSGGIQGYDGGSTYDGCSFNGTINGGRLCGGIVGYNKVAGISISDCHASATITSVAMGDAPGEKVGGIIGMVESGNISECSFEGSLTAAGKEVGGIVGCFNGVGKGKIEKCNCYANISTAGGYVGGIAGRLTDGTISECTVQTKDGSKMTNSANNNVGGIVGWDEKGDVSKCSVNMDISANVSYVGGIIGNFYEGNISDCNYTGTITANNYAGGIAGSAGKTKEPYTTAKISGCFSDATLSAPSGSAGGICGVMELGVSSTSRNVVEYCYSVGSTKSSNGQSCAGVVGDVKACVDVKYCYATGPVQAQRGVGGVIGRVANGSSNAAAGASNNSVISCHAYNSSIKSLQTSAGYGSGTIAGFVIVKNTFQNCYRHPAFGNNDPAQTRFSCANEPNELPVDQGLDINADNPITVGINGTTSAKGALSMQYTYPFHGNVAGNDCDTMTKLAIKLGWDETIWDLSGERPTLKNNPEPTE